LDTTNPNDPDSMHRFQQLLIAEGIIDALRKEGVQEGDTVKMGEWEFDFVE
jgi:GTP-binding protein